MTTRDLEPLFAPRSVAVLGASTDPSTSRGFADFDAPAEVGDEERGELMAFADQVGKEDEALVEGVREGLESGLVPQGRLITSSEHQIAWFQRLVYEALSSRG